MEPFTRTELLLGSKVMERLRASRVAVFGIGGVGSYAAEGLARSGIGALDLFDSDTVSVSNLNRQLVALHSTVGRLKTEVMAERIREINPACAVSAHTVFYSADTADSVKLSAFDYLVDAIDTVSSKLELIERAVRAGVPVISAMGAGNKLDPTRFEVADISETSVCPLARVVRKELRARGIERLKVVYSREPPLHPSTEGERRGTAGRPAPGSISFVPSVAGLILAGEVVKDLGCLWVFEKP